MVIVAVLPVENYALLTLSLFRAARMMMTHRRHFVAFSVASVFHRGPDGSHPPGLFRRISHHLKTPLDAGNSNRYIDSTYTVTLRLLESKSEGHLL